VHKSQVQPIPLARSGAPANLDLKDFLPTEITDSISAAGKITFHAVGDTAAGATSYCQQPPVNKRLVDKR